MICPECRTSNPCIVSCQTDKFMLLSLFPFSVTFRIQRNTKDLIWIFAVLIHEYVIFQFFNDFKKINDSNRKDLEILKEIRFDKSSLTIFYGNMIFLCGSTVYCHSLWGGYYSECGFITRHRWWNDMENKFWAKYCHNNSSRSLVNVHNFYPKGCYSS